MDKALGAVRSPHVRAGISLAPVSPAKELDQEFIAIDADREVHRPRAVLPESHSQHATLKRAPV